MPKEFVFLDLSQAAQNEYRTELRFEFWWPDFRVHGLTHQVYCMQKEEKQYRML